MSPRKALGALLISLIGIVSTSAAKDFEAESKISSVTVYPQWAKISRTAEFEALPGVHTIKFANLPLGADENSFRVSAHGVEGASLLGFNQKIISHLISPNQETAEIEKLIQNIVRYRKKPLLDLSDRLTQQKELLIAIGKFTSEGISDEIRRGELNSDGWESAYGFYQEKMALLLDSIRAADHTLADLNDTLKLLGGELEKLRSGGDKRTRVVAVDLEMSRPGKVMLEIEYVIHGAYWSPLYDASYDPLTEKTKLSYYANITQNTGEDWANVRLTLSTAQPSLGVGPGEINPWYLQVLELLNVRGGRNGEVAYSTGMTKKMEFDEYLPAPDMADKEIAYLQAEIMTSGFDAVFQCPRSESIRSGGEPERVSIGVFEFETKLSLIARPKLADAVFRMIGLNNSSEVPILPGPVSVFSESGFLGHTSISELIMPGNELSLAFGRDNNFKIERKALLSRNSVKWGKRKKEETIQIVISNSGSKPREVRLEEPTPISQDNRIKVDIEKLEPKPEELGTDGIAWWMLDIQPNSADTVLIEYEIEFPPDLQVLNL